MDGIQTAVSGAVADFVSLHFPLETETFMIIEDPALCKLLT
jgi:phosphoglycerate dehydrogenase-like enzyme